ncbi:MAG: transposase [Thermoplasmataceae archaeon]
MEIPIFSSPQIVSELLEKYRDAFPDIRLFRHFEEIVNAMQISDKRSIAHLNSLSLDHVNQSNMNRFLSSGIDEELIFQGNVNLINTIEKDGILAIDDTIVEKTGKNIEAAGWIFDHSIGKTVWGIQITTSVLSGRFGMYPISAEIYQRMEKPDSEGRMEDYRTKIEMQIETIGKCISAGLHFSIVTGDIWYFTKDMVKYLDEKKLDWVFQSKGNRKIKIRGRWTTLEEIDLSYTDSRTFTISGNTYSVWEIEGRVKGIGSVKAIISEGISGRRYYVTNHRKWKAKRILETYLERWVIEVLHRDYKQDGLGGISLRKLCKTELYLRLIVSGRTLLEIASIRSLNRYPGIPDRVGKRKRWIAFEMLENLFMGFREYGDTLIQAAKKSITDPYRSSRGILERLEELNVGKSI